MEKRVRSDFWEMVFDFHARLSTLVVERREWIKESIVRKIFQCSENVSSKTSVLEFLAILFVSEWL